MTLTFLASWLLCTLSATVFAAVAPKRGSTAAIAFGFLVAALLTMRTVPGVSAVAGLTLAVAMFVLARPQAAMIPALAAGALSGVITSLLRAEGVPVLAAAAAGLSFPITSAWLSARPSFAPETLREEAALLVLVLAAVVASAPTVADGWRSAVALNLLDPEGRRMAVPDWTVGLTGVALALGGLFRWWRRV